MVPRGSPELPFVEMGRPSWLPLMVRGMSPGLLLEYIKLYSWDAVKGSRHFTLLGFPGPFNLPKVG